MTRGFVTIATGKDRYYRLAQNLLASYRLFARGHDSAPFAIICDRTNDVTARFDDVVVMSDPSRSYNDKLRLLDLAPYDETIFIDADCLAYRDLNSWWDLFANASDFSCFGSVLPMDSDDGWFKIADVGEYADAVGQCLDFQGGVYFLRKGDGLRRFGETVEHIREHYHDYRFRYFVDPADEPIFALAMAVHGMTPVDGHPEALCWFPKVSAFVADIESGRLDFSTVIGEETISLAGGYLIHWGVPATQEPFYHREAYKARRLADGKTPRALSVGLTSAGAFASYAVRKAPLFLSKPGYALSMVKAYLTRYLVLQKRD